MTQALLSIILVGLSVFEKFGDISINKYNILKRLRLPKSPSKKQRYASWNCHKDNESILFA